jgi:oxygen-independent coproporphyrinogen-3 oxidase
MVSTDAQPRLLDRYERATHAPPLMMLYPPISTGRPYDGTLGAEGLWKGSAATGTLYVHVPFCHARCAFCPFYAVVGSESDYADYAEVLLTEAALYAPAVRHMSFSSIYFGGGTPSVVPPALIARLLRELGKLFRTEGADVSLEANPMSLTRESARALCAAGVTRLSLGVQAFDPRVLEACGRGETIERVIPALEAAMAAPLRDVMYGLPEQDLDSWVQDLGVAARNAVPGLTLYGTVYLPSFQERCEKKGYIIPTAERRLAMYDLAYDYLTAAGYAQPHFGAGAFQRGGLNAHRINVSLGLPTLGLGTWAFSSSATHAWHNLTPAADWAREVKAGKLPIRQLVTISPEEEARKYVIEALLLAYVGLDQYRARFGEELTQRFANEIALLERTDLARLEYDELRLTRKGGRHLREIRYLFASEPVVEALESGAAQGL